MSEAETGKQLLITPDVLLKIDADLWEDGGDRFFFDYDGVNSSRWHEYEEKYRIDLITAWCEENGISYIWSE